MTVVRSLQPEINPAATKIAILSLPKPARMRPTLSVLHGAALFGALRRTARIDAGSNKQGIREKQQR